MNDEKENITEPDENPPQVVVGKDLLINALKCIDAASTRGAYRGGELSTVGSVRDALYVLVADEVEKMMAEKEG
jgi:hypothetical protein